MLTLVCVPHPAAAPRTGCWTVMTPPACRHATLLVAWSRPLPALPSAPLPFRPTPLAVLSCPLAPAELPFRRAAAAPSTPIPRLPSTSSHRLHLWPVRRLRFSPTSPSRPESRPFRRWFPRMPTFPSAPHCVDPRLTPLARALSSPESRRPLSWCPRRASPPVPSSWSSSSCCASTLKACSTR